MDPKELPFETTEEVAPLVGTTGQDRAVNAIEFGLQIKTHGYNIFASGATGTGKNTTIRSYLERYAAQEAVPDDWCYVYNFKEADAPRIIRLPLGKCKAFQEQVSGLLSRVREDIGKAFRSEEYKSQRQRSMEQGQQAGQKLFEQLREEARKEGFSIQMSPVGPALVRGTLLMVLPPCLGRRRGGAGPAGSSRTVHTRR